MKLFSFTTISLFRVVLKANLLHKVQMVADFWAMYKQKQSESCSGEWIVYIDVQLPIKQTLESPSGWVT